MPEYTLVDEGDGDVTILDEGGNPMIYGIRREDAKAEIASWDWEEHSMGIIEDAGDVGGDIQLGPAVNRRWFRPTSDGHWEVMDFYAYEAADYDYNPENGRRTRRLDMPFIQVMAMFTECTDIEDVGGTETWGDIEYWNSEHQTSRETVEALTTTDVANLVVRMKP